MASFWPEPVATASFARPYFMVPPGFICGPYLAKLHAFGRGSDLRLELRNELLVLKWLWREGPGPPPLGRSTIPLVIIRSVTDYRKRYIHTSGCDAVASIA